MTNLNINSVKLVNQGNKGVIVTYAKPSEKNKREFLNEHVSKFKAPIHVELETQFDLLKNPLLDICGYPAEQRLDDVDNTEIVGITYNNKGFIITGKKKILDGEKTINLVTPLIKDEDFPEFADICKIMDSIYSETESYINGEKMLSDEQIVLKFSKGKEDFDIETFNKMSDDEKRDFATKVLEEQGHVVLHAEDMTLSEEDLPVAEEVTEAPAPQMNVVDDDFDLPAPTEKPIIQMISTDDGFEITASESQSRSTAKRIAK